MFNADSASLQSALLPEPNRMPFLAVAIFAFMLLGFLGIRYDWASTLLGSDHLDDAKQESMLTAGDKPLDQRYDAKPSRKTAVSGAHVAPRRNEREKRVNHR